MRLKSISSVSIAGWTMAKRYRTSLVVPEDLTPHFMREMEYIEGLYPTMSRNTLIVHGFLQWVKRVKQVKMLEQALVAADARAAAGGDK
jgi:hypothetical protein